MALHYSWFAMKLIISVNCLICARFHFFLFTTRLVVVIMCPPSFLQKFFFLQVFRFCSHHVRIFSSHEKRSHTKWTVIFYRIFVLSSLQVYMVFRGSGKAHEETITGMKASGTKFIHRSQIKNYGNSSMTTSTAQAMGEYINNFCSIQPSVWFFSLFLSLSE